MFYANGQTRLIEGLMYTYFSELNAWKCNTSGRIITEQQIQEMEYMMYNEDSWDDPQEVVQEALSGSGTFKAPADPTVSRSYQKDFNEVVFEVIGRGGTGGSILTTDIVGVSAGGGGAGGHAVHTVAFNRADNDAGLTFRYEIDAAGGVTLEYDSPGGGGGSDVVLHVEHGGAGSTLSVGAGGAINGQGTGTTGSDGVAGTSAGGLASGGRGAHATITAFPISNGLGQAGNKTEAESSGGRGGSLNTFAGSATYFGAGGGGGASAAGATTGGAGGPAAVRIIYRRK